MRVRGLRALSSIEEHSADLGQSSPRIRPGGLRYAGPAQHLQAAHDETGLVSSYLDDFSPGSGLRSRPRAWLASDAPTLSLNGDWKFRWSPIAYGLDDAAADPNFDEAAWDTIPVPSHWVLPGTSAKAQQGRYGRPRSEEHTSELQSLTNLVCRLLLEKKKKN